jgi:hypothetical protein
MYPGHSLLHKRLQCLGLLGPIPVLVFDSCCAKFQRKSAVPVYDLICFLLLHRELFDVTSDGDRWD